MSEPVTETELRALGSLRRQCLFAVTILLVEDSRSASEAIRLFAAESGARVRRADSLHAASRHLAIYRPNVVMVDLGLPDGDGMALIRHLASASTPIAAIVALSGHERAAWQGEAIAAGRGGLPGEADREPARPSRSACSRCCRTPRPAGGRTSGEMALDGPGLGAGGARGGPAPGAGAARRGDAGGDARDRRLLRAVRRLGRRDARRPRARRRGAGRGRRPAARCCSRGCSTGGSAAGRQVA